MLSGNNSPETRRGGASFIATREELGRLSLSRWAMTNITVYPLNSPEAALAAASVWVATEGNSSRLDKDVALANQAQILELEGTFNPDTVMVVAHRKGMSGMEWNQSIGERLAMQRHIDHE